MNDQTMKGTMDAQRKAFLNDGLPNAKIENDRIDRVEDIHIRLLKITKNRRNAHEISGISDPAGGGHNSHAR